MTDVENGERTSADKTSWVFLVSLAFLAFVTGGFLAIFEIQPFQTIRSQLELVEDTVLQIRENRPTLLRKKTFPHVGAQRKEKNTILDGVLLLQGWFSDGPGVRIINYEGQTLHKWRIDFFKIWPDPSHIFPASRIPKSKFNFHTQGMVVHSNGTIVVSLGNLGTAKLDACSRVVWTVNRSTHHVITSDGKGGYWIAANKDLPNIDNQNLLGKVTRSEIAKSLVRYENIIIHVDENGIVTKEFSLLRALMEPTFENHLFDSLLIDRKDPTHLNDIEIVTPELAARIAGVKTGDLLVSIRQLHMLAILNSDSGSIVWHQVGPWVRQHDPDIMPNGKIRVFNNSGGHRLSFQRISGSNIIEIDPENRAWEVLLPVKKEDAFYTDIMGSYQSLPNGHHLVAESRSGRVIQFSDTKSVVWEYFDAYDESYAALIEIAEWVPEGYFTTLDWNCSVTQ